MCHFPTAWVMYPASDNNSGRVTSPSSPPGWPYIGGRNKPWRMGNRPVMSDARDGVQDGSE